MYCLPNNMMQIIRQTPPFKKSLLSSIWREPFKFNRLKNDCSIHEFISKRFSTDLADNAIDPFCRGVFGGDSKSLSAKACFPDMFKYQMQHGSILLGSILGRKKPYDSESSLVNRSIEEKWATWNMENGLQTLIEGLQKKLQDEGVHIFSGNACKRVDFTDGKVNVFWDKGQISADHIVFSTFSSDISKVLQKEQEELRNELDKIDAVTVGVSTIEYKGDVFPSQYRGFGHLVPSWESSAKNLGVVYESCVFPEHDNKERPTTRLTVMSGGAWFDKVFGKDHTQGNSRIEEESIKSVRQQLGIKDEPMRIETNVHKDCLPQYKVGHCDIVNKVEELSSNLPVSFIGSSFRGVSVLDCIWDAKLQMENLKSTLTTKEV
ncbi:DgyrCDS11913 [Dimorphilus gyrociliatus]|nr:DgyrCDS11913 [Dimorphilus gyrociliatus]